MAVDEHIVDDDGGKENGNGYATDYPGNQIRPAMFPRFAGIVTTVVRIAVHPATGSQFLLAVKAKDHPGQGREGRVAETHDMAQRFDAPRKATVGPAVANRQHKVKAQQAAVKVGSKRELS